MVTPPRRVYRDRLLTWTVRLAQLRGALASRLSGRAEGVGEGPDGHGGSPPPAAVPAQVFVPRQISGIFSNPPQFYISGTISVSK